MGADEQRELDLRKLRKQTVEPQRCTFAPWRQIAALCAPGVAKADRHDGHRGGIVEALRVDTHPVAQALATAIVPRDTARMHSRARRLTDDEDACAGANLQHGSRPLRQMRLANAAGAHFGEQGVERVVGGENGDHDGTRLKL